MSIMKILTTSKVLAQNKITIKEGVAEILNIQPGDFVTFLKTDDGNIILKNLSDVEIKEVKK